MTKLAPYGSTEHGHSLAMVGKGKTPENLAARMPSPEIVAKVGGKNMTPASLAALMPSPEIVAKVGLKNPASQSLAARMPSAQIAAKVGIGGIDGKRNCRVTRRNAKIAS